MVGVVIVDGIEVVEFDLPYSNHAGLFTRALVFLRYSWYSLSLGLDSDADLVFATTTPLTAGIPESWLGGSEALLSCLRFVTYGPSFPEPWVLSVTHWFFRSSQLLNGSATTPPMLVLV